MYVEPGTHLMQGDEAIVEGALIAGCRFFAGYPITPATEIAERMSRRMPQVGGVFMQMEDELASIMAIIGASWAGRKSMTATSGPGYSLMQEGLGYAIITETPVVIVDVQRGGPSTGLVTLPSQGDVMQARHGSHGDYPIVVLAPASVRDMYFLTIEAFKIAFRFSNLIIPLQAIVTYQACKLQQRVLLRRRICVFVIYQIGPFHLERRFSF